MFCKIILQSFTPVSLSVNQTNQLNQIRTKMVDHRMVKDHKKRKILQEHGPERFRINMVRKSKEIPRELKVFILPYMSSFILYLSQNCIKGRYTMPSSETDIF